MCVAVQLHGEATLSYEPVVVNGRVMGYCMVAVIDRYAKELEFDSVFIVADGGPWV